MNNAVATRAETSAVIEDVLVNGNLDQLSPEQRIQYYDKVCKSLGLNPLTKPFDYLKLNGRLVLYAKRDCTDQLRSIHKISVTDMTETERDGVIVVTAKVQNAEGRTDIAKGAVTVTGLKGDALANSIMKCETKAKRRATLSICGLGFLDETELETLPQLPQPTRKSSAQAKRDNDWDKFQRAIMDCQSARENERLREEYRRDVYPTWKQDWIDVAEEDFEKRQVMFSRGPNLKDALKDSIVDEYVGKRRRELEQSVNSVNADELTRSTLNATIPQAETVPLPPIKHELTEEPEKAGGSTLSKADYIRHCHNIIDAAHRDDKELLAWWNDRGSKEQRRRVGLTPEELRDLMDRVTRRAGELRTISAADYEKQAG